MLVSMLQVRAEFACTQHGNAVIDMLNTLPNIKTCLIRTCCHMYWIQCQIAATTVIQGVVSMARTDLTIEMFTFTIQQLFHLINPTITI